MAKPTSSPSGRTITTQNQSSERWEKASRHYRSRTNGAGGAGTAVCLDESSRVELSQGRHIIGGGGAKQKVAGGHGTWRFSPHDIPVRDEGGGVPSYVVPWRVRDVSRLGACHGHGPVLHGSLSKHWATKGSIRGLTRWRKFETCPVWGATDLHIDFVEHLGV